MQIAAKASLQTLLASALMCLVMGSIHAFSVFLAPLETLYDAPRSAISLTYSFALIMVTLSVLAGPRIYTKMSAARIFTLATLTGAAGAALAGSVTHLVSLWLFYSVIFGAANGLAYGYSLQISAQAFPGREGFAMGLVTAAYALGAVLAPGLFEKVVAQSGFGGAMGALGLSILVCGAISVALTHSASAKLENKDDKESCLPADSASTRLLWLAYFGGVLAGLMVIGHAAAIAVEFHPGGAAWHAPMVIAICNLAGSLFAGRMADVVSARALLASLSALCGAALAGLAIFGASGFHLFALGVVGFCYGGTIATYPAAISKMYGAQAGARVFGRVFTAWGAAGLLGPWLAGFIYDQSGGYTPALFAAILSSALSTLAVIWFYAANARRQV